MENCPTGHDGGHDDAPTLLNCPVGHAAHACVGDAEDDPDQQRVQPTLPVVNAVCPDGHVAHDVAFAVAAYVPTRHAVQLDEPAAAENVPAAHDAQAMAPALQ